MGKKGAKKRRFGIRGLFLIIILMFAGIVFHPTTILLLIAMLPTIVALAVDRTTKGLQGLTVGAMNLAGTSPYLLRLWEGGQTLDLSLSIILKPQTIIVIYALAGAGYMLDWAVSGFVRTLMVQRAESRLKQIKKEQSEMVKRWGREVTGELVLDEWGFPIEQQPIDHDEPQGAIEHQE